LFPRADFEFLIQGEIVHPDGAARAGGLCNSHPEKAVAYQQEHGEADLYVWDCLSYHGKDLSPLPHRERHVYAARLVEELRPYSDHIHLAEEMPASGDPAVFYDCVVSDRRGLPFSEGVVVKDLNDPTGCTFYKVKAACIMTGRLPTAASLRVLAGMLDPAVPFGCSIRRRARAANWAALPYPTTSDSGSGIIVATWKARP
jgi:hypothetical protein